MRQLKEKVPPDNWRHLSRTEVRGDRSMVDLIGQYPNECSKLRWQSVELTKHIQ